MKNSLAVSLIIVAVLVSGVAGYFAGATNRTMTTTQDYTSTVYSTATAFKIQPITTISTRTETSTSHVVSNLTKSVTSTEVFTSVISAPDVFSVEDWNITINGYTYPPNDIAYNPVSGEIYLSGAPSNVITVVNANTHNVSTFAVPGIFVGDVMVDPKTNTLLAWIDDCIKETNATCIPSDVNTTAVEINGTTDAVIRVFPLNLGNFAVNFATDTIYETHSCPNPNGTIIFPDLPNCGFLSSYDLKSGSLLANVSLGIPPSNVIVNPQSNMIYTVAGNTFAPQQLLIINGTTNLVQSETPLSFYVTGLSLQINPNTNTVFALGANASSTIITALDGSSGRIIYSSVIGSACSVDTIDYSVNSLTNQIYSAAYNGTLNTNYLLILNAANGQLINMLSSGGYAYTDSAFNLQANETYLLLQSPISPPHLPAPDQLVSLPTQLSQTYVDSSLLTSSNCYVTPVG